MKGRQWDALQTSLRVQSVMPGPYRLHEQLLQSTTHASCALAVSAHSSQHSTCNHAVVCIT
eukprot:4804618-Prymnesium_polylepis.1